MTGIRAFGMAMAVVSTLGGILTTGEPIRAETLTVGAAPSLKAAFQEIVPMFEKEHGATVRVLYGPSQTLRRQIEKGAPIDVFLPAAVEEVEKLHAKGLTLNGAPRIYAQTSLVLVMSAASRAIGRGMRSVNAAPPSGQFSAITEPPCASATCATTERPRPVPVSLVL